MTPFPVGASLTLHLTSENHNVHVKASVVYAQTGMGMGLAFTEITGKQEENLKAWLRELNGESPRHQAPEANEPYLPEAIIAEPSAPAKSTGVREALGELVSLLQDKKVLSEAEVELLRDKMAE